MASQKMNQIQPQNTNAAAVNVFQFPAPNRNQPYYEVTPSTAPTASMRSEAGDAYRYTNLESLNPVEI